MPTLEQEKDQRLTNDQLLIQEWEVRKMNLSSNFKLEAIRDVYKRCDNKVVPLVVIKKKIWRLVMKTARRPDKTMVQQIFNDKPSTDPVVAVSSGANLKRKCPDTPSQHSRYQKIPRTCRYIPEYNSRGTNAEGTNASSTNLCEYITNDSRPGVDNSRFNDSKDYICVSTENNVQ